MPGGFNNTIFWVEVEKIRPNPYQPRKEFDEDSLRTLADSIRQYGVLQPLVVTRHEVEKPEGGMAAEYELIAGERRLRAAKLVGVREVPILIRSGEETDQMKLELAIIENLQREDLNPLDRGEAFNRLFTQFHYNHVQIGQKIGRSREYVSNSIRLLLLPDEIKQALRGGNLSEGHARALLMLNDKPEEQKTIFKETLIKKLTVREVEKFTRRAAMEKARLQNLDPRLLDVEKELSDKFGARVQIDKRSVGLGGQVSISYTSLEELGSLLEKLQKVAELKVNAPSYFRPGTPVVKPDTVGAENNNENIVKEVFPPPAESPSPSGAKPEDDVPLAEKKAEEDTHLYSVSNFTI